MQLLTRKQLIVLTDKISMGDIEARNQLVESYIPLVKKYVRENRKTGIEKNDLEGECFLALIHAAENYKISFSCGFGKYAAYWFKHSTQRYFASSSRSVKIDKEIMKMSDKCFAEGVEVNIESIQEALKCNKKTAINIFKCMKIGKSEECTANMKQSENSETDLDLTGKIATLGEREQLVIKLYFGIKPYREMNLEEIGCYLGMTRENVRKIKMVALEKLKERLTH